MIKKVKESRIDKIVSKRKALTAAGNGQAVSWTRVSSEDQYKNNNSIDTQLAACHRYCENNNKKIKFDFGGTFESAKKAGEKFLDMVGAVLNDPEVDTIVVYDYDRFSRNMEEGLAYKSKLKRNGITIVSVNQPIDQSNVLAEHIEAILLILADIDNSMRRNKCYAGMVACINRGEWYSRPPLGYTSKKVNKEHRITVNADGHILKKAWEWLAEEPELPQARIVERLRARGLEISKQHLSSCLRNSFYCGRLEHAYLNGRVIKGKQEQLISEALFDKVQLILDGKRGGGYEQASVTPRFPLKGHIFYKDHLMSGYTVKKKDLDYYKYSDKNDSVNISAKKLHVMYAELLNGFKVPVELRPVLVEVLKKKFTDRENTRVDDIDAVKKHLATIKTYIKTARRNFAIGKVDEDAYRSAIADLEAEKDKAEKELEKLSVDFSNLANYIEDAVQIACDLGSYWGNQNFELCQKIQKLVFPNGVKWDKENSRLLTDGDNEFFDLLFRLSDSYKSMESKKEGKSDDLSSLVAGGGLVLLPDSYRLG